MHIESLRTYDHYGYAAIAVLGTAFAVAAIRHAMRAPTALGIWVRSLHGVAPPFINIIGILFGLTLAFIANDTWNAHDRATSAVYREADALRSLLVLSEKMEAPLRERLRTTVREFAHSSAEEWDQLAQRKSSIQTAEKADSLLLLVADASIAQSVGVNVQALMLRKASEVRDDRNLRISLSQMHLNPLKWLGMAFLGLLTLLSIAAVHLDNPKAALVGIVLFSLSAAPTAAIVLIQGNPFQMPSSVSPLPILSAVGR